MKMFKTSLIIIALNFCGAVQAATQDDLFAHKWFLGILNQEAIIMSKFGDQKPFMQFNRDNTFAAFVGCSQISGSIVLTPPNGLIVSANRVAIADASCQQEMVILENKFLSLLPNIKTWEINKNNVLNLKGKADDLVPIAILVPEEPY